MAIYIQRRDFITLVCGAAAAWPVVAAAQQPVKKMRSLGFLLPGLPEASMGKATRDRLRGLGYTEGRDILLEARWADGKMERLDELAVELARLQLDAIIAYTTPGALAARKACGFRKPQIRAYRWCSPPRIGCAIMSPNRSIGRVQGASLPSERCVRTSL